MKSELLKKNNNKREMGLQFSACQQVRLKMKLDLMKGFQHLKTKMHYFRVRLQLIHSFIHSSFFCSVHKLGHRGA